jgi:hypothetical protein
MPPIRITKVMPTARITLIEICVKMLVMLLAVRKIGDSSANTPTRATSATPMPASRSTARVCWRTEVRGAAAGAREGGFGVFMGQAVALTVSRCAARVYSW